MTCMGAFGPPKQPEPTKPPAPSSLAMETAKQIRDLVRDTLSTPLNGDTTESFLPKAIALLKSAFAQVRAQERERCADIADQHASCEGIAQRIAAAIREGGDHE